MHHYITRTCSARAIAGMRLVQALIPLAVIPMVLIHFLESMLGGPQTEYGKVFGSAAFATAWTVAIHVKGHGNEFLLGWWCFFWVNAHFVLLLAP